MPTPPVNTDSPLVEWVVAGLVTLGGIAVAAGKRAKGIANVLTGGEPVWVKSVVEAIYAVNEATTANFRETLHQFGHDTKEIRSAQERMHDDIEKIKTDLAMLLDRVRRQ